MKDLIRKYSGPFSGTLAQTVQRITGVLLLAYLFLHVRTVYALSEGPEAFDHAVAAFRSPFFKLLEIALLGVVILHALNGVRITLIDVGISPTRRSRLFWIGTVGAGAIIFLAGAIPLFISSVLER